MRYDLLIKNGYVVDYATGREGYFDVAVQNGLVTAVESSISGSAAQEIDASGWCDQCFGYVGAGDQCVGAGT